jgi:hypothetical protein
MKPFPLPHLIEAVESDEYKHPRQVFAELNALWDNSLNDPDSDFAFHIRPFVDLNRITVARLLRDHGFYPKQEWGSRVFQLRQKLSELLLTPPRTVTKLVPVKFLDARLSKPQIAFVSEIEYRRFIAATENLSVEENLQIEQIASESEPELVSKAKIEGIPVNLAEFKPETFRLMEQCARQLFEARGEQYPL